jgi:putative transposase
VTSSPSTPSGCGGCTCCSSSSWTPAASTWPASPATPNGGWVAQQARNLLLVLEEQGRRFCFVLRDRDAKFTRGFDDVFGSHGAEVLLTPVQAPNANAYVERWVRTVRAECLDWLLIIGRGHLEQILRVYAARYNAHRPHRALGLEPPDPPAAQKVVRDSQPSRVHRCDLLGGLIHEYHRRAA